MLHLVLCDDSTSLEAGLKTIPGVAENVGQALEGLEHSVESFVAQTCSALELLHLLVIMGIIGEAKEVRKPGVAPISNALFA